MASSKEYLNFILEQLSEVEKVIGGIYDDRFLLKAVKSAKELIPNALHEIPYEGAKEMLLVDDVENKEFLKNLFEAMYDELPVLKKKKK